MIRLRVEEILKERGISKVQFADLMGIKKQNVNVLLETNNIKKLKEIATVLGVDLTDLWIDESKKKNILNGFVEYNGDVYTIKSIEDMENLINLVQQNID